MCVRGTAAADGVCIRACVRAPRVHASAHVGVRVRACACVHAPVRACVRVRAHACVHARTCVHVGHHSDGCRRLTLGDAYSPYT